MKNLLLLSLLAVATFEASAQTTPAQTDPSTTTIATNDTHKTAKERRADRKTKAPQVYKGTVAEQNRVVTDAAGAEGDQDGAEGTTKTSKKSKHKSKD